MCLDRVLLCGVTVAWLCTSTPSAADEAAGVKVELARPARAAVVPARQSRNQ